MLCKIAELITEVPAGGMAPRCAGYLAKEASEPEIIIRQEYYRAECWPNLTPEQMEYMESGMQFYWHLLRYNGLMLHASAAALGGRAYLFSGPCGRGKSTHTHLWQQTFGEAVQVFNDDKPALRRLDGRWYAYGTPWCGKDGINLNQKWPLGGICFLEKSQENRIRRLSAAEALPLILSVISLLLLWPGAYTVTESTHTLTSRTSTPVFLVTTYLTSLMMERQTVAMLTPFSTTMCSSMETVPSSL
jgi:hypothetical protein